MKKALITGITGQDGSYLSELLLEKGYEVHGIVRRNAIEITNDRFSRLIDVKDRLILHGGDIQNENRLFELFDEIHPDECYHLAAQSFVKDSFDDEETILETNIRGTKNILFALRRKNPSCKFYFAGSSEMFGMVQETPQTEKTPFYPRSPYAISKVTGFDWTRLYREAYDLFTCSGILFNHESPRRGSEFVTRKITKAVANISRGLDNTLVLGNLDAKRDWGFSGDYVQAMWLMLQQDKPDDYVIATGKNYSIKEFVNRAFDYAGISFEIIDLHNLPRAEANTQIEQYKHKEGVFVIQHPDFYRPAEVNELLGDASKARTELGWSPNVSFDELVEMMIKNDLETVKRYK